MKEKTRPFTSFAFLSLLLVLAASSAASTACVSMTVGPGSYGGSGKTAMKRRLVHVDHVDPAKATQFEDARRQLLTAYAAKGLNEGTTTIIETKDDEGRPEFLSIRPFGPYADIDKLNDAAAARAAAIGGELESSRRDDARGARSAAHERDPGCSVRTCRSCLQEGRAKRTLWRRG